MDQLGDLAKHLRAISFVMAVVSAAAFFAIDLSRLGRVERAEAELATILEIHRMIALEDGRVELSTWARQTFDRGRADGEHPEVHEAEVHIIETDIESGDGNILTVLPPADRDFVDLTLRGVSLPVGADAGYLATDTLTGFSQFWDLIARDIEFEFPTRIIPTIQVFEVGQPAWASESETPETTVANFQSSSGPAAGGQVAGFALTTNTRWRPVDEIRWFMDDWSGTEELSHADETNTVHPISVASFDKIESHYRDEHPADGPLFFRLFAETDNPSVRDLETLIDETGESVRVYLVAYDAQTLIVPLQRLVLDQVGSPTLGQRQFIGVPEQFSHAEFDSSFPYLDQLTQELQSRPIDLYEGSLRDHDLTALAGILEDVSTDPHRHFQSPENIDVMGLKLDASEIQDFGIAIIALMQLYFVVHLFELNRRIRSLSAANDALMTPWMGLYGGWLSKLATIVLTVVFPVWCQYTLASAAGVLLQDLARLAALTGFVLGLLTFLLLLRVWARVDALLDRQGLLRRAWRWGRRQRADPARDWVSFLSGS